MNKPLFLFVGRSASGKTTIANMLEKDGYSQIASYTTRPPRHENEVGHTFISDEEYHKLENIMASTVYNGYRYCTTLEQVQNADIYVVDIEGVRTLLNNYDKLNRPVHIIYFDANVTNRIRRMMSRGDSDTNIVGRLLNDEDYDWYEKLQQTLLNYSLNCIKLQRINSNVDLHTVYNVIRSYMKYYE